MAMPWWRLLRPDVADTLVGHGRVAQDVEMATKKAAKRKESVADRRKRLLEILRLVPRDQVIWAAARERLILEIRRLGGEPPLADSPAATAIASGDQRFTQRRLRLRKGVPPAPC